MQAYVARLVHVFDVLLYPVHLSGTFVREFFLLPRSEDTLRLHFSQYGVLESAEVMKDRYSGKSRGFGFVTFVDPKSAQRALSAEHTIDGRQCQAKIALPKGDAAPARTTRIFIARIPASVTEQQFRGYFERFGKVQDAYMPKDYQKQGYRGIGFVTFASADSVEKVMASKHA
jgi:RNA-binding protein Musashi